MAIKNIIKPFFESKVHRPRMIVDLQQPDFIPINKERGIYYIVEDRIKRMPNDILFNYKISDTEWKTATAVEFDKDCKAAAKGLIAKGIKHGDAVSIIGKTSYNWIVADYSCAMIGAIAVPIYETSSAKQIKDIFNDSDVKLAFVDSVELRDVVESISKDAKKLKDVMVFAQNAIGELQALGKPVSDADLAAAAKKVKSSDMLTIVYTSGSTGESRGVELTHSALASIAINTPETVKELILRPGAVFLLFLPLAHIFARMATLAMISGIPEVGVSGSVASLLDDLRYLRPTFTIAVPRIFEKVINAASQKAGGGVKGKIFNEAVKTAIAYSEALETPDGVSPQLAAQRALYDPLVYKAIREVFGGRFEYAVCGGAPLSPNISHFFRGAGIPILEGYGLTESAAPAFVARPTANHVGSVGYPFPGVEFKITDSGELLLKCPSLFSGYHHDPKGTASVMEHGWFHTGDLARENEDGSVSITGRRKEIIVTAGGKNISPGLLEGALKENKLISNAVLIGDRRPFVSAIVTIDPDIFESWKAKNKLESLKMKDAVKNAALNAEVQRLVDKSNQLVSRAESIRKFVILPEDFSEANDLLTASMKIKRAKIMDKYQKLIDSEIYGR